MPPAIDEKWQLQGCGKYVVKGLYECGSGIFHLKLHHNSIILIFKQNFKYTNNERSYTFTI